MSGSAAVLDDRIFGPAAALVATANGGDAVLRVAAAIVVPVDGSVVSLELWFVEDARGWPLAELRNVRRIPMR